jgi:hypothetical protein
MPYKDKEKQRRYVRKYLKTYQRKKRSSLKRFRDRLQYKYSLSIQDFDEMLSVQLGKCAACRMPLKDVLEPHIDHDHACCPGKKSCGKCVRGLLCARCNKTLGNAGDSIDVLNGLIRYLLLSSR